MKRAIVLFGHGSRDPGWRRPMDAVAEAIRRRAPEIPVACAFLEFGEPDLPGAVAQLAALGATVVQVMPLFLGIGAHARQDLPRLVAAAAAGCPHVDIRIATPAGERPELVELLAELALREPV